jgi:hypothetical protein
MDKQMMLNKKWNEKALQYYNTHKFYKITKPRNQQSLIQLIDTHHEFIPTFNKLAFIHEWRSRQQMANAELLIGLGDKNKIKINPQGNGSKKMLVYNLNRRIVRTLRFESNHQKKIYTILNVYEVVDTSDYEGTFGIIRRFKVWIYRGDGNPRRYNQISIG